MKSDSPLTMPEGGSTYSSAPLSLTALPIFPGTRGPEAPTLGMSAIFADSALAPVSTVTVSPTCIPVVLLRLRVVPPALVGAASPAFERPSR